MHDPSLADDLPEIVYIDHYGNAMTGIRAGRLRPHQALQAGGMTLPHARTFAEGPAARPFWYENANGLVEIALNRGSAASALGLRIGSRITLPDDAGE